MAPIVVWIVVALAAAAVVLLVASVAGGRSGGLRQFLTDLRAGLRRDKPEVERTGGFLSDARRDLVEAAEADVSSVDQIFTIGQTEESAYLGTAEIAETLGKVAPRGRGSDAHQR